jgi:hypothetical protein
MHLASDYIHSYKDARGRPAHCRVRIYLPEDIHDVPVVICSELPNNPGGSITNSAEVIAPGVIRTNELPTPLVWIEHWPEESTEGCEETLEPGRLLELRGRREGTLPWVDAGMDRGCYMEALRPR